MSRDPSKRCSGGEMFLIKCQKLLTPDAKLQSQKSTALQ